MQSTLFFTFSIAVKGTRLITFGVFWDAANPKDPFRAVLRDLARCAKGFG